MSKYPQLMTVRRSRYGCYINAILMALFMIELTELLTKKNSKYVEQPGSL